MKETLSRCESRARTATAVVNALLAPANALPAHAGATIGAHQCRSMGEGPGVLCTACSGVGTVTAWPPACLYGSMTHKTGPAAACLRSGISLFITPPGLVQPSSKAFLHPPRAAL